MYETIARRFSNRIPKKNWPKPVKYIGGGINGKTFLTNNGRLMKIVLNSAQHEYNILKKLRNTGVTPRVKNGNVFTLPVYRNNRKSMISLFETNKAAEHKKLGFIVMNYIKGNTLNQFNFSTVKNSQTIVQKIKNVIHKMHAAGVNHRNFHRNNIIITVDANGDIHVWAIDFGRSKIINANRRASYSNYYASGALPNNKNNKLENNFFKQRSKSAQVRSNSHRR